ncbi:hypothetical protein ANCDUO_02169 [Ancylostoma duodenale]|uniref:Uncharacterized protein n=1 Tax=Ancylostoma duodenale TaxID=51022 RepID=A0A0C2DCC9_9BILA|nr:hypothetical protein ANCDUO_02169 [Ancylostoma duodenale]
MRVPALSVGRTLATVAGQRQPFKVVEVGARDGLQNEKRCVSILLKSIMEQSIDLQIISTEDKVNLINRLSACGLKLLFADIREFISVTHA